MYFLVSSWVLFIFDFALLTKFLRESGANVKKNYLSSICAHSFRYETETRPKFLVRISKNDATKSHVYM